MLKCNQNCHHSIGVYRIGHSSEDGPLLYGQMPPTIAPQIHTNSSNPKKQAPEMKNQIQPMRPFSLDYSKFGKHKKFQFCIKNNLLKINCKKL
jgi:hypothetical protein